MVLKISAKVLLIIVQDGKVWMEWNFAFALFVHEISNNILHQVNTQVSQRTSQNNCRPKKIKIKIHVCPSILLRWHENDLKQTLCLSKRSERHVEILPEKCLSCYWLQFFNLLGAKVINPLAERAEWYVHSSPKQVSAPFKRSWTHKQRKKKQ